MSAAARSGAVSGDADTGTHRTGFRLAARLIATRLLPAAVALWLVLMAAGYGLRHAGTGWSNRDAGPDRWFVRHRTSLFNTLTHYGTLAAETVTVCVLGAVLFVLLRLLTRSWRPSLFLAAALIGEVSIFLATTAVVDRSRPDVPRLDQAPPTSSFPSGHTAASVALYGGLAFVVWWATRIRWARALALVLGVLIPVLVATCRLYRGMHYPTDVTGGALFSLTWLWVCSSVVLHRRADPAPDEDPR